MTVLCIDDDQDDLDLIQEAVKNAGPSHHCLVALTGQAGMKLLETVKPDLILLDINMPVMSGWELIKIIRGQREFDEVPVYMLSTTSSQSEGEMFKRAGAHQCLSKPYSFHELCVMMKDLLNEKRK